MKYCSKCITPDSRPNVVIDAEGICSACRNFETRDMIDWKARENSFESLLQGVQVLGADYDCMIPVSGGKDSTWQVVKCLSYGLRVLAYTWRPPGRTDIGRRNLDNLARLGVDHVDLTVNPVVEKKFTLASFRKFGTNAIPMHFGIYSTPLRLAVQLKIPLIIYGENSAFEYGNAADAAVGYKIDGNWLTKYGVTNGTGINDWIGVDGLTERDLRAYAAPSVEEVERAGTRAVFLGYYFPWDVATSLEVAVAHGFYSRTGGARTGYFDFADIDDDFISIHHWIKWYKFGFTRSFDNLSLEIRHGRVSRSEAVEWIRARGYERPSDDIGLFCSWLGISECEFDDVCEKFRNAGIWKKDGGKWKIPGYIVGDFVWP